MSRQVIDNTRILEPDVQPRPIGLTIASWTCWAYGILQALGAMVILTLALRTPQPDADQLVTGMLWFLIAGAYCFAGYGLRKATRTGRRWAVLISGVFAVLQLTAQSLVALLALPINLLILSLVILNWSRPAIPSTPGAAANGSDR